MVSVRVKKNYRVECSAAIDLPFAVQRVWQQLEPWSIAATWDPFHRRIVELDGTNRVGGRIIIDHRFGPICLARVGRLLKLLPGREFAFSDLSAKGINRGFPHIYRYILSPLPDGGCRLTIHVQGHWTLRIGRRMVWLWLMWVMMQIKMRMRWELSTRLIKGSTSNQQAANLTNELPRRA